MNSQTNDSNLSDPFLQLIDIIKTLRSPEGCPWDREQTAESLRSSLLDETLEVLQGINQKDKDNVQEELGDVLLVVFLMARIYEEKEQGFTAQIFQRLNEKLIRRHPHVFGDAKAATSDEVVVQWDKIKAEEKKKPARLLEKAPKGFPPLERAFEIQKKAAKVGFDWEVPGPVLDKVREELLEVEEEINQQNFHNLEGEIGDLLFSVVNLARITAVHPSLALERTNHKFMTRFALIEDRLQELGLTPDKKHLELMEQFWQESKSSFN